MPSSNMGLLKRISIGAAAVLGLAVIGVSGFAWMRSSAYESSASKVYDVPVTPFTHSAEPEVLARGKHLAEALLGCAGKDCHAGDLGGGKTLEMGPLGKISGPNITPSGMGAAYSDAELLRLLSRGIRKDGTTVRFMPVQDWAWLPRADVEAVVSYVRSVPPVERPAGPTEFGALAKVLDRQDMVAIDVARRIVPADVGSGPPPSPTAEYGRFLVRVCTGCHGKNLSGGPIPGAPPSLPVPSNLTPHQTGLAGWTYEDFDELLVQGIRKNGKKVLPFMPTESFGKLAEVEKRALFAYLLTLPPRELGGR